MEIMRGDPNSRSDAVASILYKFRKKKSLTIEKLVIRAHKDFGFNPESLGDEVLPSLGSAYSTVVHSLHWRTYDVVLRGVGVVLKEECPFFVGSKKSPHHIYDWDAVPCGHSHIHYTYGKDHYKVVAFDGDFHEVRKRLQALFEPVTGKSSRSRRKKKEEPAVEQPPAVTLTPDVGNLNTKIGLDAWIEEGNS